MRGPTSWNESEYYVRCVIVPFLHVLIAVYFLTLQQKAFIF